MKISTFPSIQENAQVFTALLSKMNMDSNARGMVDALRADDLKQMTHVVRCIARKRHECIVTRSTSVAVGHFAFALLNQVSDVTA